ncbi:2-amino-4-hydroxy-6-hydroxymethyldihydropteridine diphosphokinase [Bacillus sp. CGMCC 1.16607]|uniref:2-amino-4-hydroxy-6- hydroxymethyldihydropteridine diphosphokinase n=1 Tax=Bacillus sp. CGMCC 1.16607 TaxID=3351842 RepID=UPI00363E0895
MQNQAFISLGSNIEDRLHYLESAVNEIGNHEQIEVVKISSIYETDPVGYTDQDLFLNMVISVVTKLTPEELLSECQKIEWELGRKREIRWGPRTIDLDILLYNQENMETEKLVIPHPRMHERAFVLVPFLEIASDLYASPFSDININELQEKEGVRLWKRKSGEDVFAPIEN